MVPGYFLSQEKERIYTCIEFKMYNVRRAILGGNRLKTQGIYVRPGEPSELHFKAEDDESDKHVDIIDWNELSFVQFFYAVY